MLHIKYDEIHASVPGGFDKRAVCGLAEKSQAWTVI
jgi:hypothetical protein